MRTIKSMLPKMVGFLLIMMLITSVIYPAAITGAANVLFGSEARGSIITGKDGKKYGSALLAQDFTGNQYMWGRIMNVDTTTFTDKNGEPLLYAKPSNKTPAGREMEEMAARRVEKLRAADPEKGDTPIPVDLITCSGSGLDPDISPAAADYQAERIAKARGISTEDVEAVIKKYTKGKLFGILGEARVNVLEVNLALDGLI